MAIKQFEKDFFSFLIDMGFKREKIGYISGDNSLDYTREYCGSEQHISILRNEKHKIVDMHIRLNGPESSGIKYDDRYKDKEDLLNVYAKFKEYIIENITFFENEDPSTRITANLNIEIMNNYEEICKGINCDYRNIDEINRYITNLKESENISFIDFTKIASSLFIKYLVDIQNQEIRITNLKELLTCNIDMNTRNYPTLEVKDFWFSKIDKLELIYKKTVKKKEIDPEIQEGVKAYFKKMGINIEEL